MKTKYHRVICIFLLLTVSCFAQAGWKKAEPGWRYEWPRDHRIHADFKTEWWYFTGHLRTKNGRRFGYQLTFFRQGLRSPESRSPTHSRFIVDDVKFGHFAVTDVEGRQFRFAQQLSRGAFGEAGFGDEKLAWLKSWVLSIEADGAMRIVAKEPNHALSLRLKTAKPLIVHGEDGISRKAEAPGHASHYYSATRLLSSGNVEIDGEAFEVEGESWFDHEWASNQLASNQAGWDWFSVQFDDQSELMLYQLRRKDGSVDPASSGTWIAADGTSRHLRKEDIRLTPTRFWESKASGAKYPIGWNLDIPSLGLSAKVSTPVQSQELVLQPVTYWEGLIDVQATQNGRPLEGCGYLELTGYAGSIVGLSAQ
jgi:predicted secreted hydrolase